MKFIQISILIAFIAVTVFGFVGMAGLTGDHQSCIATLAENLVCTQLAGGAAGAFSGHSAVYHAFSLAVLAGVFAALLVAAVASAGLFDLNGLFPARRLINRLCVPAMQNPLAEWYEISQKRDPSVAPCGA